VLFEPLEISDTIKITPKRIMDARGSFSEVFRSDLFRSKVADVEFVQHNQSLSVETGTIRGLHFQLDPAGQGKLIRCLQGSILDVAVDLRRSSPTYGRHAVTTLTAEAGTQLWIPVGFAHGFCTLEPNTTVFYSVTSYYSPEHDRGLLWNDPDLAIAWPVSSDRAVVSDKDARQPTFKELSTVF
jgi:dTDP-4-dehydrorhamnose 3,5-epimerase